MSASESSTHVSTGISGLDEVLLGGFLRGGFYLVQGDPGSGKTTLALQFLLSRVKAGCRCLYITLTESRADLENTCKSHGWRLDDLNLCDLTEAATGALGMPETSVFHPSETELGETTQAILTAVEDCKPEFVVFDGLSEMRLLSGVPLIYRRQLLALKEYFLRNGATAVLLDDGSSPFGTMPPESLMGGGIVLERFLPQYGRTRRQLHVTKVRGSNYREGYHDYEIAQGGIVVYPRLIAAEHHQRYETQTDAQFKRESG